MFPRKLIQLFSLSSVVEFDLVFMNFFSVTTFVVKHSQIDQSSPPELNRVVIVCLLSA